MDKFFALRAQKQEHIINAALTVFGRSGYKKASVLDIANEAGIAKGMVIYYFGSKKNLYAYLTELCSRVIVEVIEQGLEKDVTDFFDRIKMSSEIKIGMMKKHPSIISFMISVYKETAEEVADVLKEFRDKGFFNRKRILMDGTDTARFKDGVDPKLLDKFFVWAGEGMINDLLANGGMDGIDEYMEEFYALLDIMKKHLYK